MGSVHHFQVHEGGKMDSHACATCAFYHPNTDWFGWNRKWIVFRDGPTANAIKFAECSAYGGGYASLARIKCRGDMWQQSE